MSRASTAATAGHVSPAGDGSEGAAVRDPGMFTVCPKCALTLVVTAADLRVAQGYVRCGRCSSVFNALARLTEERHDQGGDAAPEPLPEASVEPAPPPGEPAAAADPGPPPAPAPHAAPPAASDDEVIPEDALEFNPATIDVASLFVQLPAHPQWTAATGSFRAMLAAEEQAEPPPEPPREPLPEPQREVEVELNAALLESVLLGKPPEPPPGPDPVAPSAPPERAAPRAEEPAPAPAAERATAAARAVRPAPDAAAEPAPPRRAPEAAAEPAPVRPARERREHAPPEPRVREAAPRRTAMPAAGRASRLASLAWGFAAVLALLGLLAQIVNHYRDELAASARLGRPLAAVYASLGVPLAPHWDLHAYDVRQLGASVEAGAGQITVRASIKNGAPRPQPLPLLRVTLQDRFGNRIAARDVAPRSYLPRAARAGAFLYAGERIDAQMGFVDPGANAVGFEIDACLTLPGGAVSCASDAAAR